jgi:integrase
VATIRERKKRGKLVFHVQVRMAGFPAITASFPTRRLAERWATTKEAEMIEGRHFRGVEARRRTLAEAIDRYLQQEVQKLRDGRMHRYTLPWWRARIGRLKLSEITPELLVRCRDEIAAGTYTRAKPESKRSIVKGEAQRFKRSGATVNRYLIPLSRVFNVARKQWHWLSHNPMESVAKLPERSANVRFLSDEERGRLLKETAKDPQLHTFTLLALSTAARAGELSNLRWGDVDLKARRLLLRITKNAQERTAWVTGEALRMLKKHSALRRPDDDRVFASKMGKRYRYDKPFNAACKAAKVEDFTFHGLRHSAATYLARAGATEQQLKAIGGWKSGVVSRYVHLAAEDAKAVLERMNRKLLSK